MSDQMYNLGNLSKHYSSQSATSCYQECKRKYLFNYKLYGTGIVPIYKSIPLTTGGCVHSGVQNIITQWVQTGKVDLTKAIEIACTEYNNIVIAHPLASMGDQQQTINEQVALTEALIRLWYLLEWPKIQEHYNILAVEQEITFNLDTDIIYQSRSDLILQHKHSGEVVGYSLKTIKRIDDRTERQYKVALQAATEPYAIDQWLHRLHAERAMSQSHIESLGTGLANSFMSKGLDTIVKFLDTKLSVLPDHCSVIRFCYLVKGDRQETSKGSGEWKTDNPFIYGYRKFTPSTIEYAWTEKINKPQNKSGWGKLGVGWEKFQVWDCNDVGGIEGWIQKLLDEDGVVNDIGIGEGSCFQQAVLSDADVWARKEVVERRIRMLRAEEEEILNKLRVINQEIELGTTDLTECVDECFPFTTSSCYFPSPCEYLTICPNGNESYKEHIAVDPLNPEYGAYEHRIPHHKPELIHIKEMYGKNWKSGEQSKPSTEIS